MPRFQLLPTSGSYFSKTNTASLHAQKWENKQVRSPPRLNEEENSEDLSQVYWTFMVVSVTRLESMTMGIPSHKALVKE